MKKVLFVCTENSCRSQMAEAFARHMGKSVIEPYSAGSKPSGSLDPGAIDTMLEAGIDISTQSSKSFSDIGAYKFDIVVTMGCMDVCPVLPSGSHLEWHVEDPKGKGPAAYRKAREMIRENVKMLVDSVSFKSPNRPGG